MRDRFRFACGLATVVACLGSGLAFETRGASFCKSPNLAIPDGNPGAAVTDSIVVGPAFPITDVNVKLVITHTWVGDLQVQLSHGPPATTATLIDRPGVPANPPYGCSSHDYDIVLDDEGMGGPIETLCGPGSTNATSPPNYTPNNPLSVFDGQSSAGSWTIRLRDNASPDAGTLDQWCLIFNETDIDFSPSTTHFAGATHIFDEAVYTVTSGSSTISPLASFLPLGVSLDALDVLVNGDILFSVRPNSVVNNGGSPLTLKENSIYKWDGSTITLVLDPQSVGVNLPNLDALDERGDGTYAVSTSTSSFVSHTGGTVFARPWQVYVLDPVAGTLTLLQDFGSFGITDVDGVDVLPNGDIAVSSSTDVFGRNGAPTRIWNMNVYIYNQSGATWTLGYDLGALGVKNNDAFNLIREEAP